MRITRAYTYTQQAITVNASEDLNIVGGFADCAATATDNGHTTVSGTGGAQAPVFRISVANGARVKLRHLDITGGDNIGYGGGIYFTGGGTLEIMESPSPATMPATAVASMPRVPVRWRAWRSAPPCSSASTRSPKAAAASTPTA